MIRVPTALTLAAALSAALAASQGRQPGVDLDFVEIDATVIDAKGRPIHGLQQGDFSIKDDGRPVTISTFSEVRGPVPDDPDSARTVVLLLDDTGVSPVGTRTVQTMARAFVSSASSIDDLPVVRLHARDDEPFGDRISGEARINEYRGGSWPFVYWSTTKEVLERVAGIARLVAANTSKRRVIVCIGSPYICNVSEPQAIAPQSLEGLWASALRETAKANVVVYALVPARSPLRGGGVPESTGGEVLASARDMAPSIDRILQDAANFYMLGYWPVTTSKGLHRVEVKVTKGGAKVRARRFR